MQRALTRIMTTKKKVVSFSSWSTLGDYRAEAWLEDPSKPLYQFQKDLPRLPVPTIDETLERFLPTALPLAKSSLETNNLQKAVQLFPSQAKHLQERLLQRQQEYHDSSWLQHWWNTEGYLKVRDSVVINVSYYFHFKDDPTTDNNNSQIQRAAALLFNTAEVRNQIVHGTWPPEHIGKQQQPTPLCSTAYKYMFHSCRIPHVHHDTVKVYNHNEKKHAVVACKGHFFVMDILDQNNEQPLSIQSLERGLKEIRQQAEHLPPSSRLGILTSSNRDTWAKAREDLVKTVSVEDLEALESAAVMLCLDDDHYVSRAECAKAFLHGNGYNRWFDKSIQLIVLANGKAGLNGEHSMMDGMPVVAATDYITKTPYASCRGGSSQGPNVRALFQTDLSPMHGHIEAARDEFDAWVGKHEIHVQTFQGYGSNLMKTMGFSPDAFAQMAMQLATFRLWGEQAGTYEATQVRPFLHGRTETTRSVSIQSEAFVKAMGLRTGLLTVEESKKKLQLLQDAVDAHVKYMGNAAKGKGVDRHFLGLSMLVGDGEKAPDLYSDPVFIRSKRWRVSTSNLTHPQFDNWGYGEVFPDGVGLSYSVHPNHCNFSITALKEHEWTDKLAYLLEEALLEMRTTVEMAKGPSSKL